MKRLVLCLLCGVMLVGFSACDRSRGTHNNHEWIDLGLPSGTLWAACNVGANAPEDYGDYFAWGEVQPKEDYSWDTYKYGTYNDDGDYSTLTKYNPIDGKVVLEAADDAAIVNWGGDWRMPTPEEISELIDCCEWTLTDDYNNTGVVGCIVTGTNENSIFLPATGVRNGAGSYAIGLGQIAIYFSSSLSDGDSQNAYGLICDLRHYSMQGTARFCGQSVRAVCSPR